MTTTPTAPSSTVDDADSVRTGNPAGPPTATLDPNAFPHYFDDIPNYARTQIIRKFVDRLVLPGGPENNLHNVLPVAVPDTVTYPDCDYYEIGVREYSQKMHSDLPATLRIRGFKQLNNGTDGSGHNTVTPPTRPWYFGPAIRARRGRPVRVKYVNQLPTGALGQHFLPVDLTIGGAGPGPSGGSYSQNRTALHLHGMLSPWISDGTPQQWTTPAGETGTPYLRGVGTRNVPDMPDPGPGAVTLYYPNDQSARFMWLHDHALGITRLNVYSGMTSIYLLNDPVEQGLVAEGVIPGDELVLVFQDKTYVPPDPDLALQDPTWNTAAWGGQGNFWFPHVYMPNQNPYDPSGANAMGRWDYGPWFWPPFTGLENGPVPNPYFGQPGQPPVAPGTPRPSIVPEAFMDTPIVNGTPYPYVELEPKAYRLRILNACNDRYLNLQLYHAASDAPMWNPNGTLHDASAGEVPMVEACGPWPPQYPNWPSDGREGGVPDPLASGPDWIQIGNEGGFLPQVAIYPNQPINYVYNRRDITVLNVSDHTCLVGPSERADVIIDFSGIPTGANLILYNDGPAPFPGFDPRNDYYTGDPDQVANGGAPTTVAGYGPNTRTIMQIRIVGTPAAPFDVATLESWLPTAFAASQEAPIVPESAYGPAYGTTFPDTYVPIQANDITFTPIGGAGPITLPLGPKSIQEDFDITYGRMNAVLGTELPNTNAQTQNTVMLPYINPATEVLRPSDLRTPVGSANDGTQLWKVTHNGVGTHTVHFHLFNVQLINRVGWDGAHKPPDPNELGWKEAVRMNPLEDVIVAMRPRVPALPFKVGDSIRLLDPTQVAGTTNGFAQVDPITGDPMVVANQVASFGWEYVWHGRLLGHEENDMMRPLVFLVSPSAPTGLTAIAAATPSVSLHWTNTATAPAATDNLIERATDPGFTAGVTQFVVPGSATSYTDTTVAFATTYCYRVRAETAVSYSGWSNTASATVSAPPAPTSLVASVSAAPPLTVQLPWVNHATATSIDLQRATNASFTTDLRTWNVPNGTTFTETTPLANTTYYYRVRANVGSASSAWSGSATVSTPAVPATPTGLVGSATAPPSGTATATLGWQESTASMVGSFTLQRATNASFSAGLTSFTVAGPARSYVDTGLARNTTYYYRIQAVNAAGTSAFSVPASVRTPA